MGFEQIVGRIHNTKCNGCGRIVGRTLKPSRELYLPGVARSAKPFFCSGDCETRHRNRQAEAPRHESLRVGCR